MCGDTNCVKLKFTYTFHFMCFVHSSEWNNLFLFGQLSHYLLQIPWMEQLILPFVWYISHLNLSICISLVPFRRCKTVSYANHILLVRIIGRNKGSNKNLSTSSESMPYNTMNSTISRSAIDSSRILDNKANVVNNM